MHKTLRAMMVLTLAVLSACSTANKPQAPVVLQGPTTSPVDRLEYAIELLQQGNAKDAETELHGVIADAPDNKQAQYLIAQIDSPVSVLFPSASFSVKLAKDETLSSLAHTYLGNSLGFYGLARFNNIAVPEKVVYGQLIHIPKTADAIAALTRRNTVPNPVTAVATAVLPAAKTASVVQHKQAQEFYRKGVMAFQRQDLDAAIGFWTKCLAIEPDNSEAELSLAQAFRLKSNLAKLRGETVSASH